MVFTKEAPVPVALMTPAMVCWGGSVLAIKPVPYKVTVRVCPEPAVGRVVGEIELSVAVELCAVTVTLKVTVIVLAAPQVRITAADITLPGCADAKSVPENVTGMVVPKLYAKPDSGVTDGASVPAIVLNV